MYNLYHDMDFDGKKVKDQGKGEWTYFFLLNCNFYNCGLYIIFS